MNRFRLKVLEGVTDAIKVMSTVDRSHSLTGHTDEEVCVGRDDVCIIKNNAETPARLQFTGHAMRFGRTICRPSRQTSFTLHKGREETLTLGPGESIVVRSELALDPKGYGGAVTA